MASAALRVLKLVGESSFWRRAGKLHTKVYRLTGGKVGHRAGKLTNLLLTTTGRKSGKERTVTLAYITDGENYVVVASNGGADRHPAWWLNLEKNPHARIQVGDGGLDVVASKADAEQRARLWPPLKAINPFYASYEKITGREMPIVILRRATP